MWPIFLMLIIVTVILYIAIGLYSKADEQNIIIRDVDLNEDMLAEHGEEISYIYKTSRKANVKALLINKLDESFKTIEKVYLKFNQFVSNGKDLPKGSEWLLDNFYIIELSYKELKAKLKEETKIVLNTIETGPLEGYPVSYALALELISHS